MKKEHTSLFSNLFGMKPVEEGPKIPVVLSQSYSQSHVLQQRMKEEKLTHGEVVTANLSPVRLEANFGKMIMYFCPLQTINILQKVEAGDGGALPAEATLKGIEVPGNFKPGLYDLKNVKLYSNGTMQVIVTADTVFEAV